jgi:uncharacterized protein YjbI with pentapeptide repeats
MSNKMNDKELKTILDDHIKWLNGKGGKRAYLRDADLSFADLSYVNLKDANLSGADLRDAYNLETVLYNENTSIFALICPEKDGFKFLANSSVSDFEIYAVKERIENA